MVCTTRSAPTLLWWLYRCDCGRMTSHGFSITAPFACTMRMSSSDAGSPSDRMTTFACPSSEYHEKLVAMRYRSSLPVFGTADAHAAPVLMSKNHHEVSAVDPDVSQQQRGKRSCLSIGYRCRTMTSEGHEEYSISRSHLCWVLVAPAMSVATSKTTDSMWYSHNLPESLHLFAVVPTQLHHFRWSHPSTLAGATTPQSWSRAGLGQLAPFRKLHTTRHLPECCRLHNDTSQARNVIQMLRPSCN